LALSQLKEIPIAFCEYSRGDKPSEELVSRRSEGEIIERIAT